MPLFPKSSSPFWDRLTMILSSNPTIKERVKTLQMWTGDPNDLVKWTVAALPALRMTPLGRGAQWSAERQHDQTIAVQFDLAVAGTYAGDIMDFWDAVQAVWFPADESVLNTLQTNHQVYSITATNPAYSVEALDDNYKAQHAQGVILFKRHVNT